MNAICMTTPRAVEIIGTILETVILSAEDREALQMARDSLVAAYLSEPVHGMVQ